jgi:hypothetical protein
MWSGPAATAASREACQSASVKCGRPVKGWGKSEHKHVGLDLYVASQTDCLDQQLACKRTRSTTGAVGNKRYCAWQLPVPAGRAMVTMVS